MERVRRHPVAYDLSINLRVAMQSRVERFEYDDARAFAHHEAVPVTIERTAGFFRRFVLRRHGAHGAKPADAERRYATFGSTANHDVGVSARDDLERIANRMSAGCA